MSAHDEKDDAALFRAAIGEVQPLRREYFLAPGKPQLKPAAHKTREGERAALSEFQQLLLENPVPLRVGDVSSYCNPKLPKHLYKRLKRGQFSIQDELDLHGASAVAAEKMLRQFLLEAHDAQYGCVRIVHGKGLQSDSNMPVLKNLVDRLLRQRNDVLGFHSAPLTQGGTGALLVLLQR